MFYLLQVKRIILTKKEKKKNKLINRFKMRDKRINKNNIIYVFFLFVHLFLKKKKKRIFISYQHRESIINNNLIRYQVV